jgi:hypothetical protein
MSNYLVLHVHLDLSIFSINKKRYYGRLEWKKYLEMYIISVL